MITNCHFSTYRMETDGSKRGYDTDATIANGVGFKQYASPDLKAVLGVDEASETYELITHEADFERSDKVVIASENYFILGIEKEDYNGLVQTKLGIQKDG